MKKIFAIALAFALSLSLAACGSSGSDTAAESAAPAAAESTGIDLSKAGTAIKGFSSADSGAAFIGTWEYDEYYMGYIINVDGTAAVVSSDESYDAKWTGNGDSITVTVDGEWYADLSFASDGGLVDDEGDTLYYTDVFSFDSGVTSDFTGKWEYDEYDVGITILSNGTCYFLDPDGSYAGTWEPVGDYVQTYYDGEEVYQLSFNGNGGLVDDEGDTLTAVSYYSFENSEASDFTGTWEYDEYYGGFIIYADGSAQIVWMDEDPYEATWEANGDSITVSVDGEWYADLSFAGNGLVDDEGDTLFSTNAFSF